MNAGQAVTQIKQLLRGIAAASNAADYPEAGLAAQTALVAVDALHDQLDSFDLEEMEIDPVKTVDERETEAQSVPIGASRQ